MLKVKKEYHFSSRRDSKLFSLLPKKETDKWHFCSDPQLLLSQWPHVSQRPFIMSTMLCTQEMCVCVCVRVFPFSFLFQPCSQAGELFGPHRDLETTSSCIWKASVYFENANVAHLKDWQARKDPQSKGRGFQSGALSLPLSHRDRSLSEPLKQAPGIWAKGSQFKWAAHLSQDQPGGWFLT